MQSFEFFGWYSGTSGTWWILQVSFDRLIREIWMLARPEKVHLEWIQMIHEVDKINPE